MKRLWTHTPPWTQARRRMSRLRRSDAGGAYALTLVALLVMSLLGLTLIGITQTEMVLGANEQTRQRVFYAAESGIAIATARALVSNDRSSLDVTYDDTPAPRPGVAEARVTQLHQLEISPFYPVLDVPCNFCEINNTGTYRRPSYRKVNHAVTVTASRVGIGGEVIAQETIGTMIEFQPWMVTNDAYAVIDEPEELAKIKF